MKLEEVRIRNFRGIEDANVSFADITTFVGGNDVGKSTVLSALDVFFNKNKITVDDINRHAQVSANKGEMVDVEITCVFAGPFPRLSLEENEPTTFEKEHMLRNDGKLELSKTFQYGRTTKMFVVCNLVPDDACKKLFASDNKTLKGICEKRKCVCKNRSSNVLLRYAIREDALRGKTLTNVSCELTGSRLEGVQKVLPCYLLFVADRENLLGDNVVMSPMKAAVRTAFESKRVMEYVEKVEKVVRKELVKMAKDIREEMRELNSELVDSLKPDFPSVDIQKWCDVFRQFSLRNDDGVSLDNRGSGVRRLVLMSFLCAQAKERVGKDDRDIIYAIEEPETSQHSDNQTKISLALLRLARRKKTQVVLTTHSGHMVKQFARTRIQIVTKSNGSTRISSASLDGKNELYISPLSLIEVSYLLLKDCIPEYHSELYGFIEKNGLNLSSWCKKKAKNGCVEYERKYARQKGSNETDHPYPTYVRDRLHHPENDKYDQVEEREICISIEMMREFMRDAGKLQLIKKTEKAKGKLLQETKK